MGGIACAAEINSFMSFWDVSCLSTHLSDMVASRLPEGLGFRGSSDLTLSSIGQRALNPITGFYA